MEKRMNAGYEIINAIKIGEGEIVLAQNEKAPSRYVTWECFNGDSYNWGHYSDDLLTAQKDFLERGLKKVRFCEQNRPKQHKKTEPER